MIPGFYPDTAIRHRAPVTDSMTGDRDWANAEATTLANVRLEPLTTQEQADLGTTTLTHQLRAAMDVDLKSADRIEINDGFGTLWLDVEGTPLRYRGGLGSLNHSVTMLKGLADGR